MSEITQPSVSADEDVFAWTVVKPYVPEDAEHQIRNMTRQKFMDFTIGGRAIPKPVIVERKVTRYYWNGKGYATKTAVYKAYARSVFLTAIRELAGAYDGNNESAFSRMMRAIWHYREPDHGDGVFDGSAYSEDIHTLAKRLVERDAAPPNEGNSASGETQNDLLKT